MTVDGGLVGVWLPVAMSVVLAARLLQSHGKQARVLLALVAVASGVLLFTCLAAPLSRTGATDAGTVVAVSARKGAVAADTPAEMAAIGASHGYRHVPYSSSQDVTPMLKRKHIRMLRGELSEDCRGNYDLCPSLGIAETIVTRGSGGYWLIFNEPGGEDGYPTGGGVTQAAYDACYAIRYIQQRDPTAQFILGYYPGMTGEWGWPRVAAQYGLDTNINQVIAGWHMHIYDGSLSLGDLEAKLLEFRNVVLRFKSTVIDTVTPGKEFWITEFGTLMRRSAEETLWCDDLGRQTECECRFDRIDSDPDQACVRYMQQLVGWLESAESPVDRYYWWSYGPPLPEHITEHSWRRDMCYGPLTGVDGHLNNLGRAFTAIGSAPATPTATSVLSVTASPTCTSTLTPVVSVTPSATRTSASTTVASITPSSTRTSTPARTASVTPAPTRTSTPVASATASLVPGGTMYLPLIVVRAF